MNGDAGRTGNTECETETFCKLELINTQKTAATLTVLREVRKQNSA